MLLENLPNADSLCMRQKPEGIHPALNDMIQRGQLGDSKIVDLRYIKATVDRIAVTDYVSGEQAEALRQKYGESPTIITWGDYFQTTIASDFFDLPDDEFHKIAETVRFDLIASVKIFQRKPADFIQSVLDAGLTAGGRDSESLTEEDQESLHLMILCRYFQEMGLEGAILHAEDLNWFDSFVQVQANAG
jgi:hypothetical protein